jgi:hypothetical protein
LGRLQRAARSHGTTRPAWATPGATRLHEGWPTATSAQRARQPTRGWHVLASAGDALYPRAYGLGAARVAMVLGAWRWAASASDTVVAARTNGLGESSRVDGGSSWGRQRGLGNALGDGLHAESKQGKGGRSASEGPQRRWRAAHLKKDGSGATPAASRPESGSATWLQPSAGQNLRGGGRRTRRDDGGARCRSTTEERSARRSSRCWT